jgi:hypothetical protein
MDIKPRKPRWQRILELEAEAKERQHGVASESPIGSRPAPILCRARGATLELHDDCVVIHRGIIWGVLFQHGIKGEKRIPFTSIGSVQFKAPGLTTGYIQFAVMGGVENVRGVFSSISDENTVHFFNEVEFEKARRFIEQRLGERDRRTSRVEQSGISVAEQLEKLAALLDRGLLTLEEFQTQKRVLLAEGSQPPAL